MKKILFTLLGSVLLAGSAVAQDWAKSNYGVRLGLNISNAAVENLSTDAKMGFRVGGFYEHKVMANAPLYVETGLNFSQQGFKRDSFKANLWYMEIPVLVNYKFALNEAFTVAPFAGLYYGIGIGGKSSYAYVDDYTGLYESDKTSSFGDGGFSRSDLGFRLGVTADWNKYQLSIGYSRGLLDVAPNDFPPVKNSFWSFMIGYRF